MARAKSVKPKARSDELVVSEVQEEVLVYDRTRQEAHSLNPTAALIWRNCDGTKDVPQLAALVNSKLGLPSDEDSVWLALSRLEEANLLSESVTEQQGSDGTSRRDFMKRVGLAAAATGVASVVTVGIPVAYAASSCVPKGDQCGGGRLNNGSVCAHNIDCCSCNCDQGPNDPTFICKA